MKILRLGHATYVLTSTSGKKYMIDPFLSANPGCPEAYTRPEFLSTLDGVFLTHAHYDHTQGLAEIREVNPQIMIVCQYELGLLLLGEGFTNVHLLNYGGTVYLEDVTVTMVQAVHSSSYRETEGIPIYAGHAAGYIFNFTDDYTLYHSGDTTMTLDMKLIQDVYEPDIAILSASGQFVMGPREAAYVVRNLLRVKYVIPNHQFPTEATTPRPEVLKQMQEAFPVIMTMTEKDIELKELLADYEETEVVIMDYGEEREFLHLSTQLKG